MEDSQASIQTGAQTGIQAVSEAHPDNAAMKALSELATDAKFDRAELTITVSRENIVAACEAHDPQEAAALLARHLARSALTVLAKIAPEEDPVAVRAALDLVRRSATSAEAEV